MGQVKPGGAFVVGVHGAGLKVPTRACQESVCNDGGKSIVEIGKDFYARRLKTGSGRLWVKPCSRSRRLNLNRRYRAYQWYCDLLAQGTDLYGIPVATGSNPSASSGR